MGLPNDYFSEMRNFTSLANKSTFLDLNETWLRATWSRDDVHIAAAIGATHTIAKLVHNEGGFFSIIQQICITGYTLIFLFN